MKREKGKCLVAMTCLAVAGIGSIARADIKYTQVNSMPMGDKGALQPMMTMSTFTRVGQQRVDSIT